MTIQVTCIIVEDDPVSQEVMASLVERTGFLKLQASFSDPVKAIQWLSSNSIDLILLDIEMPGLNGLQLLKSITQKPKVIIISSKEQYAVDAFDYDVVAYLLKPVDDFSKFLRAVIKVKDQLADRELSTTQDSIYIKVDSLYVRLLFSEILWVEAFGDYVKVNTEKKVYTVYATMKAVEEKLPAQVFIRVHRSFIINFSKMTNIDQSNLEIEKKIIPIGNSYREALMSRVNTL